jgi:D-aspartate ligase
VKSPTSTNPATLNGPGSRPPAIVLGGYTAGLGVARALGAMGVRIVCVWHDAAEVARHSAHVVEAVEAPDPAEDPDGYVEMLHALACPFRGGVLVPTSDPTVELVARHKAELERRYAVASADWEVAQRFLDKRRTYALARDAGIPTPATFAVDSLEDLRGSRPEFRLPCVVKPCSSHLYFRRFGRKMALVDNLEALSRAWIEAREAGLEVVVQEFIPGDDTLGVNYNAYFWEGRPVAEATAQKLRLAPPRIGFPRAIVSREVPEVREPGQRLFAAVGHQGFANVEFKRDPRDGEFKLMEMNGRHNFSTLLSFRAGVNFPWIMYRHLIDGQLPSRHPDQTSGVYWIALSSDVVHTIRSRGDQKISLGEFLLPYLHPHVFDHWSRRDPKPFLKRLSALVRLAAGRAIARTRLVATRSPSGASGRA